MATDAFTFFCVGKGGLRGKLLKRSRIELLDALLKLRQACCDSRLVKTACGKAGTESAKLTRLMEMIPELIEEGWRILLFSQFTSMLALIEADQHAAKIHCVLLTGDTKDRATPVRRFQAGEVPLFLISLKAGGTGLNLTAADTVINYDPWWNPAIEAQATDRAHRIGQDKPVFVYKLVAGDTIEVKMAELKARKQALADGHHDRDFGKPKFAGCQYPAMSGNQHAGFVHQYRRGPSPFFDRSGDLGHLLIAVRPGIAGIGHQRLNGPPFHIVGRPSACVWLAIHCLSHCY